MGVPSTYESTQWGGTLVTGSQARSVKRKTSASRKRGSGLECWRAQQSGLSQQGNGVSRSVERHD
jgi:hypothetical protein